MQFELKTQVIEPVRNTFDSVAKRFGDRPASRYLEGSIDIQPTENFHYRPTWDPTKEIYSDAYSVFRLSDPYSFLDPRQYYYAPYVTNRAGLHEGVAATLDYIESRDLFGRLPEAWHDLMVELVVPLRHHENGGQLILCGMTRFGFGATVTQASAYSAFDRVGNAQILSRVGIALGGGTTEVLQDAKQSWIDDASLQGLRRLSEETIVQEDWGLGLVALNVVDQMLYDLLYRHLDDAAVTAGAPAYSLVAQHLSKWFADDSRWIKALYDAWRADATLGSENLVLLERHGQTSVDRALAALTPFARRVDELLDVGAVDCVTEYATNLRASFAAARD